MEKNWTTGSVGKSILQFSLPYLLSYFLQTLYGMADLFIIGQYEGVASITAVSVGSQVMHMLTVMIVGVAMGTTVTVGRAIGANHPKEAARCAGHDPVPAGQCGHLAGGHPAQTHRHPPDQGRLSAVVHAVHGVGAGRPEHRRGQTRTGGADPALGRRHRLRVWCRRGGWNAVFAPWVVAPFTSNAAVVAAGAQYIRGYVFDCMFAGIQFSFSGCFCAYGKSGLSFLHNILYPAGPSAGGLLRLEVLPPDLAAHGPRLGLWLAILQRGLPDLLAVAPPPLAF